MSRRISTARVPFIQIEGTIHGDVRCAEVTVGRTVNVLGNIESEVTNIHGTVNGEVRARSVIMSSTARVTGDVIHEELTIDAGAYIEGQMMRRDAEQSRLNLVVGDNV